MNYTFWIAARYLTSRHKESFISLISLISILGVAIGVMALIVVLAVMSGFDNDLKDKIIGTNAHVLIEKEGGISNYAKIKESLTQIKGVKAVAPYINGRVFIQQDNRILTVAIRGITEEEQGVTKIKDYLVSGSLNLSSNEVVLGRELANYLGKGVDDTISLIYPTQKASRQLKIKGIFNSGMYDYDMNLVFVDVKTAQDIFGLGKDIITGVSLKLDDIYKADIVKEKIFNILGFSYVVRTWIEINRNFFAALRLEKITMFIILTLIVLVAAFNIVSTLIVIVTSKVKDIGILKTIGVTSRGIKRIFTFAGLTIGILGTFLGIVSGVALCLLLKKYQFIQLPQEIYYINKLPVALEWRDIGVIVAAAILISFLATIYPASRAAKLNPVEALRYE